MSMWIASLTREEFLGVVQGERVRPTRVREVTSLEDWREHDEGLVVVWADNPERDMFPSNVFVPEEKQNEFFGWVGSFLSGIRPFTAYCRVSDLDTARAHLGRHRAPLPYRFLAGFVGAIIGEAATYSGATKVDRATGFKACAATFSFAVAKAAAIGAPVDSNLIGRSWMRARQLTHQQRLLVGLDEIQRPLLALMAVTGNDRLKFDASVEGVPNDLAEFVFDYARSGRASEQAQRFIGERFPDLNEAPARMQETREQRIQYLDSALRALANSQDRAASSFIAGSLMSQIAPGTFDHVKILQPFSSRLPSSFMWYGLFAGLHEKTTLLNYGGGIGRRIVREITRPEHFLERPKCDIAIGELEVLSRDVAGLDFRTGSSGQVEVEISPLVVSPMRAAFGPSEIQPPLIEPSSFATEFPDWMNDLDEVIDHMVRIQQRLHRTYGFEDKKPRRRP